MTEEILEQDKYKFNEIVLVDGQFEATIRDIYTKTIRVKGENGEEDTFKTHVSYRMHEKDWWYEEILPHRVQKLESKLNFGGR